MSFGDEMKKIGEGISASYDARIGTLEDIFKDTQSTLKNARSMVKDFHTEHQHMSEEQRSELDHFKKGLMDETRKMINTFAKDHQEMANELRDSLDKFHHTVYRETHNFLNEFRTNFEKMAQEMRKMLSNYYKGDIQKTVQDMLSTYHSQMRTLANEFQKGHQAWINFSRSMQQQRGMKQAPKKMQSKQEQICSILEANPKGMTMGQIAKEMGCASQSIRTTMNNMKKQERISKKQNKFYCRG